MEQLEQLERTELLIINFSSKKLITNEIRRFKTNCPKDAKLGNGTECVKLHLSQASKDMQKPLVSMLFPLFGALMSGAEFQFHDLILKEPCGKMAIWLQKVGVTTILIVRIHSDTA